VSQITKEFCEQMLSHAANMRHSPLTIWEEEQLARAWLEREQLRERIEKLQDRIVSLMGYEA
jgi:hypothetical protein